MAKGQRRYSDSDKAQALAALDANGGNVKRTADQLGVPASTLTEWAAGRVHPEVTTSRDEKKRDLAEALEALALKLVGHCEKDATIGGASLVQAATALGIAVDKLQALRNPAAQDSGSEQKRIEFVVVHRDGNRPDAGPGEVPP